MGILITTNRISPVLGAVMNEIEAIGITPTVQYQREGSFIGPDISTPPWLSDNDALLHTRFQEWGGWSADPEIVVALGLGSAAKALEEFPRATLITIMLPGDVDFSRRNRGKVAAFSLVNERSVGFVFIDEWEMTKAVSLGSTTPHFLWNPCITESGDDTLDLNGDKIAVVFDGQRQAAEELEADPTLDTLRQIGELQGKKVEYLDSNSFYWYSDFKLGRSFPNVLKLRMRGFSHAFFLHDDIDSIVSYSGIQGGENQVMVKSSVSAGLVCRKKSSIDVSSVDTWADRLSGNFERISSCPKSQVSTGRSLLEILEFLTEGDSFPSYYEDFGDLSSFAVFLTVAPVENRSDGARPQRIRNMYLALSRSIPTIQLNFDPQVIERRTRLIEHWTDEGIKCEVVYGENSTNPVQSVDAIVQTYRMLDRLATVNATPSCWFVRDLHWLDSEIVADEAAARARSAGAFELERLSRSVGSLVSPSLESADLFNSLTNGKIDVEFPPLELPPAVTQENCVLLRGAAPGTTFLYTGGIGEAYKMDTYLDAVAGYLSEYTRRSYTAPVWESDSGDEEFSDLGVSFDFLVRPAEQSKLEDELEERDVLNHPAIRILNGSLDEYRPLTEDVIGILLLESAYAKRALPFKSVSYAAKGIRYLVYESSPAERVFGPRGIANSVARDVNAIVSKLRMLVSQGVEGDVDWQSVWTEENWDSRIRTMRSMASVVYRDS